MAGKFSIVTSLVVLVFVSAVSADTIMTFSPTPADAWDLDHGYAYGWGIDVPLLPEEEVVAATLTFDNIRNWDNNANTLYLQLLDDHDLGLTRYDDNNGAGNFFETIGTANTSLTTYENLSSTAQDLVYTFSAADLVTLNSYLADGVFGLGFDPDCHFYNDGITLALTTAPEPGTLVLLIVGAASVVASRRRR